MYFSSSASLTFFSLTDFLLFLLFFDFPHSLSGSLLLSCDMCWAMIEQCSPLCINPSLSHTHTHQPNLFAVMFSSCITCIPIRVQVPHGSYSGLKTSRGSRHISALEPRSTVTSSLKRALNSQKRGSLQPPVSAQRGVLISVIA